MAKFCSKCGKPLVDGVPCDCEKESENTEEVKEKEVVIENTEKAEDNKEEIKNKTAEVTSEISNQAKNVFNDYVETAKGIFVSPVETIKNGTTNEKFIFGLVSMVLNAIVFGFLINAFIDNFLKKVGMTLSGVQTALGTISKFLPINLNANFGVKAGISMAIMSIIIPAVVYAIQVWVLHKKANIKQLIAMVGTCEVFLTIGYLASFAISYVSTLLAIIVLAFVIIAFFVRVHQGLIELVELDGNKLAYTVSFGIFIPSVSATVILFIFIILNSITSAMNTYGIYLTEIIQDLF